MIVTKTRVGAAQGPILIQGPMQVTKKRRGSDLPGGFTKKGKQQPMLTGNLKTAVKREIRNAMETKYFDTDTIFTIPTGANWNSTLASANGLFWPQLGDQSSQREGQKVTVHKIHIKGRIIVPEQHNLAVITSDNATIVRIVYAFDHDNIGGIAAGNLIIQNPSAANNILANLQPQNIDNVTRFRVIFDKSFVLQNPNIYQSTIGGTTIEQQGLAVNFKKTIKFVRPVEVDFFKSTAFSSYADVLHNNLAAYAHCTNTDLVPSIYLNTRCYYKEVNK